MQGHHGFTPEYVIKNKTKPHLRNYSFLHSHFHTSSQTKLLIPWTFFNVHVSYGIPKIPGKQCWGVVIVVLDHYMQQPWRARWGNKVIEQGRTICSTLTAGDWPIGPCQRISPNPYILFFYEITNNIIPVHRLFLNPRYGERSTSTYPLLPDANVGQYSTSKVIFTPKSFINSAIRNVPSPQDIVMGCAAKTSYPGCVRRPNLPCAHYIWHYMMEHLFVCLVHVGVVLMYFGRQ